MIARSILLALAAASTSPMALADPVPLKAGDNDMSIASPRNGTVRARINVASESKDATRRRQLVWGASSAPGGKPRPPSNCVSLIEVRMAGADAGKEEEVFVPASSYADLCRPRTAELVFENGTLFLKIDGSDTGEHYRAKLRFSEDGVVWRRVESSPVPESFEETTYGYLKED